MTVMPNIKRNKIKHGLSPAYNRQKTYLENKIKVNRNKLFELQELAFIKTFVFKTDDPSKILVTMTDYEGSVEELVFTDKEKFQLWLLRRIQSSALYYELKEKHELLLAQYKLVFESKAKVKKEA